MPWRFLTSRRNRKTPFLITAFIFFFVAPAVYFVIFTTTGGDRSARNIQYRYADDGPIVGSESAPNTISESPSVEEARVAICLAGEARRFELTGASLVDRVINVFPNSDLFVHCPLDKDSYKLSLLNGACRIAAVRIFKPTMMPETEEVKQLLTGDGSPHGVQGLLRYFNLVEGCLPMIQDYQTKNKFQYQWIVRTRADSYWTAPLPKTVLVPGTYVVPSGLEYYGLNDRFGAGDFNTSWFAMSRLTMLRRVHAAGYRRLGSETFLKAQLGIRNVTVQQVPVPFCIMSDHKFPYPPGRIFGTFVASISSKSPLGGAYCRPCPVACKGECGSKALEPLDRRFGWIDSDPDLCDGSGEWTSGWEALFDTDAGEKYAAARKWVVTMDMDRCVSDIESMKCRSGSWDAPSPEEICRLGLAKMEAKDPSESGIMETSRLSNLTTITAVPAAVIRQLRSGELVI